MVSLKRETIEELQMIIREEYGYDFDLKEATEIAENLVGYFDNLQRLESQTYERN